MSELPVVEIKKTPFPWSKYVLRGAALSGVALCLIAVYAYWNDWSHSRQMHEDPRVARVWALGITRGDAHSLKQGTALQLMLNRANIHWFGDYSVLHSRFSGDPSGLQIWFGYQSYVPKRPELICHRVGTAAFTDDLGQTYHGFLDLHGSVVGVYLPGYDRSAKKLFCNLHWMPEESTGDPHSGIVSQPMRFTIDLPTLKRSLPELSSLNAEGKSAVDSNSNRNSQDIRTDVTQLKDGIRATVGEARLSATKMRTLYEGQRDLLFRLKIEGGKLANDNVSDIIMPEIGAQRLSSPFQFRIDSQQRKLNAQIQALIRRNLQAQQGGESQKEEPASASFSPVASRRVNKPLTVTDPYGISLEVKDGIVSPLTSVENLQAAANIGVVWSAPVTGAGKGTDVIRIHFEVRPNAKDAQGRSLPAVPFDLLVPLQTGDEI